MLIDRYLTTRRGGRFALSNLLLILLVMVSVHLLFRYVLPPDPGHHPPADRPWQDGVRFFLGNATLYALVVGVGVAIRMTGGWLPRRRGGPARSWSTATPRPSCRTSRAS